MRRFIFTFLCLSLLVVFGCGPRKVATNMVEGLVTLDGTPLVGASITFSPVVKTAGMIASGISGEQGKFTLQTQLGAVGKGTTEGEYTVTVTKIETSENAQGTTEKSVVPEVYASATTSPLKQTIVKGLNKVELKLLSKP